MQTAHVKGFTESLVPLTATLIIANPPKLAIRNAANVGISTCPSNI